MLHKTTRPFIGLFTTGLLASFCVLVITACVESEQEPTPDVASTVRNAVKEALPTPVPQPDIAATARAVVQESMPTQVIVPDAEATARAVVHAALLEPVTLPDVEATARSVVHDAVPPPIQAPDAEATARAVVNASLPEPAQIPDIEATARAVAAEELSIAIQSSPVTTISGTELRATLQSMIAVRRYEDTGMPISIDEVMIQATKFRDHDDIPSQFRLQYDNFIGLWLNNHALESWIEHNGSPASARGVCCYYLDVQEPALYRAVILDLPKLTQLINESEGLGIDSRYLAEALDRIQDGYTVVYESFTW